MKILAIRGQNLASLKGTFEIDLMAPPLSGLGLFAIAGPVGSGKSTILDAMCLALFGRTPRLSGRGGAPLGDDKDALRTNDPRSLARKGSAAAMAEVDFLGLDGRVWRARWQVRRARGQAFGRLLDDEQTLTCPETGVRFGTTNSEARQAIEEKLGLSFEELTRSVLLSQGGFAAFLQARPDERAALLEKITGTAIYSALSARAFARAREHAGKVDALRDALGRVTVLAEGDAAALGLRVESLGVERAREETEVLRLSLLAAHATERTQRERDLKRAQARADSAAEWHRRAQDAFDASRTELARQRPLLERARVVEAALASLRVAELVGEHRAFVAAQTAAEAACAAARTEHGARRDELERAQARLTAEAPIVALLPVIDVLRADLGRVASLASDLEGARAIERMHAERLSALQAQREGIRAAQDSARLAVEALRAQLPDALQTCAPAEARALVAREQARRARTEELALTAELRVEERALERIGQAAARARLVDGEPCSLCGALEHPYADLHEPVTVAAQRAAVDLLRRQIITVRDVATGADARAEELARGQTDRVDAALPGNLAAFDATLRDLADAVRVHGAAEDDVRDLEPALADAAHQRAFAVREIEVREQAHADVSATIRRQLSGTGLEPGAAFDPRALASELKRRVLSVHAAQAQVAALTDALGPLAEVLRDAERAVDLGAAATAAAQRTLDAAQRQQVLLRAEHEALLHGRTAAEVQQQLESAVLAASTAVAEAGAAAASEGAALVAARAEAERTAAQPGDEHAAERLTEARARLSAALEEEAAGRALLADDARARTRHAELACQLDEASASARVWSELSELIGSHDGARFRAFAQGLTLDTLVHHANQHLALLAPRYRLERVPSLRAPRMELSLCVVDRDAGDERRGVQSLSGGETFLVSLALALGLASLSSSRVRVESLFIDEGFSSLDPDTLEVALAAFDALRSTGRQIGVISHVPALAERIGSQVRVLPLGDGRSRVEVKAS